MRIQQNRLGKPSPHLGLLVCTLAWGWPAAQATSLGPISSAVFIGKPFVASIPLGDAASDLGCVHVQLSYGDAPVNSSFILRDQILKVRSNTPVNEPLLNLNVSADCENPITRSYTLFADMPQVDANTVSRIPSNDSIDREPQNDASDNRGANNQNFFGIESSPNTDYIIIQPLPSERKKLGNPIQAKRSAVPAQSLHSSGTTPEHSALKPHLSTDAAQSKAAPRLELDNADILGKDPQLRLAYELLNTSPSTPQAREEALARWQAFNSQIAALEATKSLATDTTVLVTKQKTQQLELRMQHNETEIAKLQAQLARERSGNNALRYTLYGVLGLLLLGLGALGIHRWRLHASYRNKKRRTKERAWWQQYGNTGAVVPESQGIDLPINPAPATNLTGYIQELPVPEVAFDSILSSDFGSSEPEHNHAPANLKRAHKPSSNGIEGLQETQEQADFFVALGEYERAENLMRRYIDRNPETSPLAYLNLLGIYQAAGKEDAFETLRKHFNHTFNAEVPDFARFKSDPRDLMSYPDTLEQLQQLWGQSEAIRFIGALLFRQPQQKKNELAFAPVAYRELLMLYSIAAETTATADDLSHIQSVTANATKWLQQPDTIILDNPHPAAAAPIAQEEGKSPTLGFTAEFNTGPSPLEKDAWGLDNAPPPEHLSLDLNLDMPPVDIDLYLPEDDVPRQASFTKPSA